MNKADASAVHGLICTIVVGLVCAAFLWQVNRTVNRDLEVPVPEEQNDEQDGETPPAPPAPSTPSLYAETEVDEDLDISLAELIGEVDHQDFILADQIEDPNINNDSDNFGNWTPLFINPTSSSASSPVHPRPLTETSEPADTIPRRQPPDYFEVRTSPSPDPWE